MTDRIKVGVIGCGWAGRQAVDAAQAVPYTECVAVADLNDDLREGALKDYDVPHGFTDYRDMLAQADLDAVYVAVNPMVRLPMVLDSFSAGKHVLVQKPHATRAEQVLEIEQGAKDAGTTLQFCYFMRHFPQNRMKRTAIESGKIGTPYHARIFLKYNHLPKADGIEKWLQVYGNKGGALGQHASHELDQAWWLMGCPKPEWAFAAKHSVYPAYDGPEGPAEDYFSGMVGLEGGKTIQIDCSRWLHCDTPTVVEVYGSEGAIAGNELSRFADGKYAKETIDEPLDLPSLDPPNPTPCFFHEMKHFAMAIRGEVEPDVSAADAYRFMQILDGLYDSAKTGEKVVIE